MNLPFERTLYAGWSDIDFNNHMMNAAYLAKCVDVRMMYFTECGFEASRFAEIGMGPVVLKDEIRYYREFRLLDKIRVTLALAGMSDDGSRFIMRNELFHENGTQAAKVDTYGGWLDLKDRVLVVPEPGLFACLSGLSQTEDFVELTKS